MRKCLTTSEQPGLLAKRLHQRRASLHGAQVAPRRMLFGDAKKMLDEVLVALKS